MTVPFLIYQGINAHKAVGTSAFCGIPIAVTAFLVFLFAEQSTQVGYIYWQALFAIIIGSISAVPLGVKLSHIISTLKLKRVFALLLIIVALEMLAEAI